MNENYFYIENINSCCFQIYQTKLYLGITFNIFDIINNEWFSRLLNNIFDHIYNYL